MRIIFLLISIFCIVLTCNKCNVLEKPVNQIPVYDTVIVTQYDTLITRIIFDTVHIVKIDSSKCDTVFMVNNDTVNKLLSEIETLKRVKIYGNIIVKDDSLRPIDYIGFDKDNKPTIYFKK
jgi:hypothetical protein